MKNRVHTGKNKCEWVLMGADGCVGVWGAPGTHKQGKLGVLGVSQDLIWVPWPGKFPRTSCFCRLGAKVRNCM